jgi:hypothetical protein
MGDSVLNRLEMALNEIVVDTYVIDIQQYIVFRDDRGLG